MEYGNDIIEQRISVGLRADVQHAVWNMVMIGGVLHIGPEPDGYALLNYVLDSASPLVTGGDFGVEASLPSIAVYLGFSALALVRLKRSKAFAHTA